LMYRERMNNETAEQRERRLKRGRDRIRERTPEDRAAWNAYWREWRRRKLAAETPDERERRLEKQREWRRRKLAAETPEEREERLEKHREWQRERRRRRREQGVL
jgi:hypothetical protein